MVSIVPWKKFAKSGWFRRGSSGPSNPVSLLLCSGLGMLGHTLFAKSQIGPMAEKKKTICAMTRPTNKMMRRGLKRKSPITKGFAV